MAKAKEDFLKKHGFKLNTQERFKKTIKDGIFHDVHIFAETINGEVEAVTMKIGNAHQEKIFSMIETEEQILKLIEALQGI